MCFAMRMATTRNVLGLIAATLAVWLGGCSDSGPSRRNIEAVYRFENLRTTVADAKAGGAAAAGIDEWTPVKRILENACGKPVQANRFAVRSLGTMEVATYEAKCVLPTFAAFNKIESEIESLGVPGGGSGRNRVETYLCQIGATYKSNFVQATVNVNVSGASVSGNRIRIYGIPGDFPAETTAGGGGIWTVRLAVVPETKWVYGLSEDPSGKIPTQYFRINVTTRQQERLEEAEFLKMFPKDAQPAPGKASAEPKAGDKATPGASRDERTLDDLRKREEDDFRKRRDDEQKRLRDARDRRARPG